MHCDRNPEERLAMELKTGNIKISFHDLALKITNGEGEELLSVNNLALLAPKIAGVIATPRDQRLITDGATVKICFEMQESAPISGWNVVLKNKGNYLELQGEFVMKEDGMLNDISIFPAETIMPMHKAVNFRNEHCTQYTWPDLPMGGAFLTTTFSNDWQFAPHPSMMLFQKNDYHFFIGALDLPKSFGLYLKVDSYKIEHFYEDYGQGEHGLLLKAGEMFRTTKYAIFVDYKEDPHEVIEHYTNLLIKGNYIPDKRISATSPWHRENLYCTWVDQGYLANTSVPNQLHEQIEITVEATHSISDQMIRDAIAIIEREKLPFTTILIDMGWSERGEWIADPKRFPNFRELVDWLHAKGYKVVVWWNWAEVSNDVVLDSRFFVQGGALNKHGQRTIDYSNPITQEAYCKPMFRRLFSSEKDCYDIDGVKTDFLSDKIHPETQLYDPAWRGEEQYFYRVFQLFVTQMRTWKKDAVHIGCAGHPYLAQFIDINRTYDVWSTNVLEHVNRGRMLAACAPGCPVAYDFHHFTENLEAYFKQAYANNCSVQIGNIMGVKEHPAAAWSAVDEDYFHKLRYYLGMLPRQ